MSPKATATKGGTPARVKCAGTIWRTTGRFSGNTHPCPRYAIEGRTKCAVHDEEQKKRRETIKRAEWEVESAAAWLRHTASNNGLALARWILGDRTQTEEAVREDAQAVVDATANLVERRAALAALTAPPADTPDAPAPTPDPAP